MAKPHNCQCHSGFTCGACLSRAPAYHFTPTRETFAEYCARPHPDRDRLFIITVKGKKHRYDTQAKAEKAAGDIFNQTGIIVGIERENA